MKYYYTRMVHSAPAAAAAFPYGFVSRDIEFFYVGKLTASFAGLGPAAG